VLPPTMKRPSGVKRASVRTVSEPGSEARRRRVATSMISTPSASVTASVRPSGLSDTSWAARVGE
jgi:hypothetical protein